MRKSSYISVDPDFRRSLVKALLRGANHIEIILNLIRWDRTCGISPKSRRPDHINESWAPVRQSGFERPQAGFP
jgi:hypothetical protein